MEEHVSGRGQDSGRPWRRVQAESCRVIDSEGDAMTANLERREKTLLSDEEVRRRMKESPAVQKRIAEALSGTSGPSKRKPGIPAEDLAEFLREPRWALDH